MPLLRRPVRVLRRPAVAVLRRPAAAPSAGEDEEVEDDDLSPRSVYLVSLSRVLPDTVVPMVNVGHVHGLEAALHAARLPQEAVGELSRYDWLRMPAFQSLRDLGKRRLLPVARVWCYNLELVLLTEYLTRE